MSEATEAQAEAERRYPFDAPDPYRSDSDSLTRSVFVQGQRTGWIDHAEWQASRLPEVTERLADALESRQPHVVTTVEELESLPVDTVIKEGDGFKSMRWFDGWMLCVFAATQPRASNQIHLPATILYTPEGPTYSGMGADRG